MISSLRGTVIAVAGTTAVVEVGGVGLAVNVTANHALGMRVGQETVLRTALIVREDDLSLYGFADAEQLAVFDLLRGVTGVGPKSAAGVLSVMAPEDVARAVAADDDAAFRKVSGIGPKTAKLIVVSLTGKLIATHAPTAAASSGPSQVTASVVAALVGLGWPERTATQAVDDALAHAPSVELGNVQAVLRRALAQLGPQQLAGSSER